VNQLFNLPRATRPKSTTVINHHCTPRTAEPGSRSKSESTVQSSARNPAEIHDGHQSSLHPKNRRAGFALQE
jgi:hypothetical protein